MIHEMDEPLTAGAVLIDRFIPNPDIRTQHEILVEAPADVVFDVARDTDLRSIPLVRMIFRLREILLRAHEAQTEPSEGLLRDMARLGWVTLAQRPGRELVMGAAARPWEADVTFTSVPARRFLDYDDPGQVKIAWTLEVQPVDADRTLLRTETRVQATDEQSRARFRRYWRLFRIGILTIRFLLLRSIRHACAEGVPARARGRIGWTSIR